jgi:hypothetical protein
MEVPSSLSHLIAINSEFGVLLCLSALCKHAQSADGIIYHLRNFHHEKPEIRRQLDSFVQALQKQDERFLRDYTTVELPVDGLSPQPVVPVVDGFSCLECRFLTTNRKIARVHANKGHNSKRAKDKDIFNHVRLQSWYGQKRERYWIVDESKEVEQQLQQEGKSCNTTAIHSDIPTAIGSITDPNGEDAIEEEIQQWKTEAKERRLTLQVKPTVYEMDAWLQFTKWNVVLSNSKYDMLKTYEFLRYPGPEEYELHRLLRSWDRLRTRALDTLENTDHKDALKWWVSPKNEVASQNPFELPQSTKTVEKYSRMWEQFICYVMRTVPEDFEDETETGVVYTQEQWEAAVAIQETLGSDVTDNDDSQLTSQLMRLCQLVIEQDLSKLKLYDCPLMHYLAIRGIDVQAEAFRGSIYYTNILAGVLWIVRLIGLEIAIPQKPWPELGLLGKSEIPSVRERVKEFRFAHLVEGSFSPASSILSQLARGRKHNQVHQSPSNIHWSEDKQIIHFVGRPVELCKIGPMGDAIVAELKELISLMAFQNELPTIDLSKVIDSTAWTQQFRKADFNFTKHPLNKELDVEHSLVLERARVAVGDLQMFQKTREGGVAWIDSRKHWYLTIEGQFLRKLMVCTHIQAGQPARGPELGSIKVVNSVYSARNIMVINGRVGILTMYDKTRKRRGNTDYIIRVLPDELSQLLAQYITYIRPFARVLDHRESEYLFADERGPWAGEELSRELAKETSKHLGVRLTVREWRHVAIGIAVEWLTHASKTWEKDDDEDAEEEQFAEGNDEEELSTNMMNHIMVRQASHGQRVAQNTYAINGAFLHRLGPQLIAAFEQASVAWHNQFGWKSEGSRKAKHTREASQQLTSGTLKKEKIEPYIKQETKLEGGSSQASIGLQRIFGPQAVPKSKGQAAALELVHNPNRKSNIIVLPTSAGKSALFFSLAAMSTHKSVIVVVPFAQLVIDLVQRALDCGLSCVEWRDESSGIG